MYLSLLAVTAPQTFKFFSHLSSLGQNFKTPTPMHPLSLQRFFSKSDHYFTGSEGIKASTKNAVDWLKTVAINQ